ncbi:MAG TPA: toprim domain-containing protein, partial [Thermoanaerobaculia bacterium]
FNKSSLLFNLHRAKDQIRKLERAILVEGYFDCITLDHSGVSGVVASMGTSLTPGQASLLRKGAPRVVIAYDGDDAGRNATLRAAPILLSSGLHVDVLDVGRGYDPDSYLRKHGHDALLELLGNARDLFDFALDVLIGDATDLTGREKSEKVEALIPILASVTDPVIRNDAARKIADRLRLEFEVVWSRVRGRKGITAELERTVQAPISTGERRLLSAILNGQVPIPAIARVRAEFFEDEACKTIFATAKDSISGGQPLDFSALATHLRGDAELTRLSELAFETETDAPDPTYLEDALRLMERRFLDRRLKELQIEIQEAIRVGDDQKAQGLDLEKMEVSRQYHSLK